MLKNYLPFVFFIFSFNFYSQTTTTIPDANFEQALIDLNIDTDGIINQSVATADISGVTSLDVRQKNISDLTGIEEFISLTYLYCANNQLTSLNVTQNTVLAQLYCFENQLISLDITQNTALTFLQCYNNQITDIDVTQNTTLTFLNLNGNQLTSIDVSQNTLIDNLGLSENQLTSLDVTHNTVLTYLQCNVNQLTTLDVSKNIVLSRLYCLANQLTSLDVTQNTALIRLFFNNNQVTSIDVTKNTLLTEFACPNNQLTSLDISQNVLLENLQSQDNQLTNLDLTNNTKLKEFYCYNNQLTSLDLTQNTDLYLLYCHNNQLESLNVKNGENPKIVVFYSKGNPSLQCIQVDNETDANASVAPYGNWEIDATSSYSEDCSTFGTTYVPDDNFEQALIDLDYDDVLDDYVVTSNISGLTSLNVSEKNITDLTGIEEFISLTSLSCDFNQLTSIDITKNTSLTYLKCEDNQLTSLSVTQNTLLAELECNENQLISLDVTQNIVLTYLSCEDNQLTSLDVSQNTSLEELYCEDNLLTSLNVKNGNNSIITDFNATNNPLLQCIQVDNEANANSDAAPYNTWEKDAAAVYSEDCSAYLGVDDEMFSEGLKFYPNPVSDILTVDSKLPIEKVEVYSILGQRVKEVNSNFKYIQLNNLSRGIYVIKLYSEKGSTIRKLIKK